MGKIFIDKHYFDGKKAKWVSFEDTQGLKDTKRDIYQRCVPCITKLYEQLKEGKSEIYLGPALHCWKVVVVLETMEECVEVLSVLEKRLPESIKIKGRFGSVDEAKSTKVMVFNVSNESEREELRGVLNICAHQVNPAATITYHRGCAELYHELFGDWKRWRETETVKKPEIVPDLIRKIRRILFWDKET